MPITFAVHHSFSFVVMSGRRQRIEDEAENDGVGDKDDDVAGQETNFEVTRTWDDLDEDVEGRLIVSSTSEAEKRKRYTIHG